MSRSCAVVGAGPAGLSAAYRLANAGVRVTVLEAATSIGGRTRTERVGDFIVNTGATFIASFFDRTLALLEELKIAVTEPAQEPGIVSTSFGKLPLDLRSVRRILEFPLISAFDKLRAAALFGRVLLRRPIHVADLASLARLDRGATVERWGRRALGSTGYDYILRSGIEPFFYFGADEASAAFGKALLRHAVRWRTRVLRDGMGTFCDALAQRLEVRTGCVARGIEERPDRVLLHHSGGTVEADYAVLAVPAPAIADMESAIPDNDRAALRAVRYAASVVVCFGYERAITVQYPSVTPAGPGRHPIARVRTISHWVRSWVPEGKELIMINASGWRSAELMAGDPSRIVTALRADAEEVFGRMADPDWIRVYPRADAIVVPQPRHYRSMQALLRRRRGRVLFAGDWLTGSTVEGAVRTGLDAAQRILDQPV
jgi:oxygen-dependent protoporphyrinogen oxidase